MEDLLSLLCDSRRVKRPCWLMLRKPMWYSKKHTGQGGNITTALQALSADGNCFIFFFSTSFSFVGNLGRLTWERQQQLQEQLYPFLPAFAVFSCVQTIVWLRVFQIFDVCTDVYACDCTWGLYGHHKRVCTES